jgi:hypothetical protein
VSDTATCMLWEGYIDSQGYGRLGSVQAHRLVYEDRVGPIPVGLELDHVCHSLDRSCEGGVMCPHRRCVNPDHLEPVTRRENVRRSRIAGAESCKHGHAFTPENTYRRRNGTRDCRACHARWIRDYRARQRAARVT